MDALGIEFAGLDLRKIEDVIDQFQKVLEARNKLSTERYNFLMEVRKLLGYERFLQLKPKSYELRKDKSRKDKGGREPKR